MQRFITSYMCAYFSKFYCTSDKTETMFYVLQSTSAHLEEELGMAKIPHPKILRMIQLFRSRKMNSLFMKDMLSGLNKNEGTPILKLAIVKKL